MPVVTIEVDGVPAKVRVAGLSVRDNLNDTPNTCSLIIDGTESPVDGQDLRITLDTPRLLFAGTLQTVDQTYEGRPVNGAWPCRGIDYTARLNYRRPFGTWVDVSATTVATELVTTFAPTFTTTFIEASLPDITITCDGSEDLIGALGRIAVLIGGYTKVEDLDVYLFLEDTTDPPDPIVPTSPYPAAVLADSPLGYWRLGETVGATSIADASGNGYTGTPTAVTFGQSGALVDVDTAASFNGTSSTIDLGNVAAFNFGAVPFTVEAFVQFGGAGSYVFVAKSNNSSGAGWFLGTAANGLLRFWAYTAAGGLVFDLTATSHWLNDSEPHHVAGTWDGTTTADGVKLYVGGALIRQGTAVAGTPDNPTDALRIGSFSAASFLYYQGTLDEVAVYTSALSGAQIAAHAALRTVATYAGLLDDPPLRCSIDDSQLRTRVYGKGHAEPLLSDVLATETILPIADDVMYGTVAAGGRVIAATTPDGAASEILTYTAVQRGGAGGLVGPGASPSAPLVADVVGGAGMATGIHQYAVTFVTGSGESLPGPLTTVTVGALIDPPGFAPVHTVPEWGGNLLEGYYTYVQTFVTATGETTASPPLIVHNVVGQRNTLVIEVGPASVTARTLYRSVVSTAYPPVPATVLKLALTIANNTATLATDGLADGSLGATVPVSNTATAGNQVALSGVPLGPASVTSRKIYRTVAAGSQLKLQQTIANNTATTGVTDATADGSLGANVPVTDTSALGQPQGQVLAGSTTIPVAGTGAFSATGGWAIVGNGEIIIRYTGVTGTTLTGVPASGPGALTVSIAYNSTITVAPALAGVAMADAPQGAVNPTDAPEATAVTGSGVEAGDHLWAYTWVTGAGETRPSASVSATMVATPATPTFTAGYAAGGTGVNPASYGFATGDTLEWVFTYSIGASLTDLTGESLPSASTGVITTVVSPTYGAPWVDQPVIQVQHTTAPAVTWLHLWRRVNGGAWQLRGWIANNGTTATVGLIDNSFSLATGIPSPGILCQADVMAIAVGPSGTTSRKVYRSVAGGSTLKLLTTIADNTTTTYTDSTADASLGATAPTVDTAGLTYPLVTGIEKALAKGSPVHLWVQRDDTVARADAAARESTGSYTSDGIHEHLLTDARRGEASLIARCDADLVLYAQPIVTYFYGTRDVKTKSGKTVHIDVPGYPAGDYVIQDVTIDQIDIATNLAPRFLVKASSVAFSLEDVLRRMAQLVPV